MEIDIVRHCVTLLLGRTNTYSCQTENLTKIMIKVQHSEPMSLWGHLDEGRNPKTSASQSPPVVGDTRESWSPGTL